MKHPLVKKPLNEFIIHSPYYSCGLNHYFASKFPNTQNNQLCQLINNAPNRHSEQCNLNSANKLNRPNRSIWNTDHQPTFRIKNINSAHSPALINEPGVTSQFNSIKINYFLVLQFFTFINLITRTLWRIVHKIYAYFAIKNSLKNFASCQRLTICPSLARKSINHSQFWMQIILLFNCLLMCNTIKNQYNKAVGAVPGDLVLGALFPVHHAPGPAQAQTRTCGGIREQYGIQRVEAAFQTIDKINMDKTILPHIMLGIEVRDSCWYSPIALEQSIEFIRDAMAASTEQQLKDKIEKDRLEFETKEPTFYNLQLKNTSSVCPKQASVKNLVGVIGPASSTVTIQVQNLLQLFNIPQIGYSATSRDLSAKNYYKYFLRVVPSDMMQAQVMIDLIKRYNWTYISVVYTEGNYGSSLMEVFKEKAQDHGICIAHAESVSHNPEDYKFDEIVNNLQQYKTTAKVVACFCEGMTVRGILKALRRLNATGDFTLFGSDGWSDRYDVVESYEEEAVGGLSVRIHSPYVEDFDDYYFRLNPATNTRNPWFKEFWEWKFNCSLSGYSENRTVKQCTGRENLSDRYKQDTKMAFVTKAIWTMAYGLHSMQQTLCPKSDELCKEMMPVNGSIFLQHLLNVSFEWNNERVLFDQNGDPPGRYDIMNFQKKENGSYSYEMIGTWDSTSSFLNITKYVHWPNNMILSKETFLPESVCSKPCKPGHAKNFQSDSVKCCWVCVACRENQFLKNEFSCENCPIGWRPNVNLTGCVSIPVKFIQWSETPSLVAIAIATIGLLMTLFTMVVFIKHNNTPVVKASTKELSYLIMVGMLIAFCTTFFLIAKPSKFNCLITRILPGFSFAVIYGSLVTKTNRIARILAGSKKRILTKKPRFMSSTSQVVISCLLICIEIGILTFTLVKEPADSMLDYPTWDKVVLICNTTSLGISAPMGFDCFLIAMCTVYAVKTRNVPENFNEAKFIGFTMYTTIVIWGAFFPIYFGSNTKVISLCLCISLSAIIALVLLFFPKIYIILLKPEKNNRSFFTTARNVRCHIGYVPTLGISRHSSHSASDVESPRTYSVEQHRLLHANILHDKCITGGFVEAAAARALLPTTANQKPTLSVSSASTPLNSKSPFSFFTRLRYRKRDKIKANVEQKIRAVRAAEALDRQTNIRRSRVPPRQSSLLIDSTTPAGEDSQTSAGQQQQSQTQIDTQKLRLLNLWKHAYLDELAKIPGLLEFIDNFKDNFVIVGPTENVGKSRRAVSMVLPKTVSEGKEFLAIENSTVEKLSNSHNSQLVASDKGDTRNGKSTTGVQTSPDSLSQFRCELQKPEQKRLQHLQNISIVKTPLSRLRPSTRTAEQKRLDYERTIAELKRQAIEVENRIKKQSNPQITNAELDKNNNRNKQLLSKMFKYSPDEENSEIDRPFDHSIECPSPPPPPIIDSSKYSILNQAAVDGLSEQEQRILFDSSMLPQPTLHHTMMAAGLPTAQELILRVNRLSCEPTTDQTQPPPPYIPNNLNQLGQTMKTTASTVRVQSQFRTRSGNKTVFSHHLPSQADSGVLPSALHKQDSDSSRETAEKNRAYHQRVSSWSTESALIGDSRNGQDQLHGKFTRIGLDYGRDDDDEKQEKFESKESLIIEESASENEEDSSQAIYKKIIISLRNSSNDLADCDYQFDRHHSSHSTRPHHSHFHHQHSSSTTSSSNQHHSSQIQSDHHHSTTHTYQTNYEQYYEQMQQLHQLAHQQPNEYSGENISDGQEELISAFSSMSRSEPNSARQSRKY